MSKDEMKDLALHLGKLTGAVEHLTDSTKTNTAEIKIFNAYMNKSIGATEERDRHYKRVKHTAMGSVFLAIVSVVKSFAGH